jgi:hypothetical protein
MAKLNSGTRKNFVFTKKRSLVGLTPGLGFFNHIKGIFYMHIFKLYLMNGVEPKC